MSAVDLTGQKFGRLTVLHKDEEKTSLYKNRRTFWFCKCDCGNVVSVRADQLKGGYTKSCGCLHIESAREQGKKYNDLVGQRFGRLLVIERVQNKGRRVAYKCRCDCGNECIVLAESLTQGSTKSCGCLAKETTINRNKSRLGKSIGRYKDNQYEFIDDYVVGYDSNGKEYFFDKEDFDIVDKYTWYVGTNGYVTCVNDELYMHNIVFPCDDGKIPEHKNNKRNDNRKSNLRPATYIENAHNRDKGKNNTSGFIGVSKDKSRNKFYVTIGNNHKTIHIGRYDNFTDAVKERILAEQKYYGDYMYKPHNKVLDYIDSGGILKYGDAETIDNIML